MRDLILDFEVKLLGSFNILKIRPRTENNI